MAQRPSRVVEEIAPGIFHWTAFHQGIRQPVSSYYSAPSGVLIDPMVPEQGFDWLAEREPPQRIVLTNRHHHRESARFVETFGCPVWCPVPGLHEFEGGPDVKGFDFDAEVAPGITALEVDAICPDDAALHIEAGAGLLAFADGLIRSGDGSLTFVPDFLMGDDPDAVKRGLRDSLRRLLDLDFDSLLFAHGAPLVGDGKSALRAFVG